MSTFTASLCRCLNWAEQRTAPSSMDRPHSVRICLGPVYHPIIYRTAAIHLHTLVYDIRPQTRHGPPAPSLTSIPTPTLRGRTGRLDNFAPPSNQSAYHPAPRHEVRPRSAMAAQALDRQDPGVADRLAMVFDYFPWCRECDCWLYQSRPGVCGNLLVDWGKALVWHC